MAEPRHFDPATGYRISQYRAPTPAEVPGGTRIGIDELDALVAEGEAVLVDVMPAIGGGYDPASGVWRLARAHAHIAGSTWLPDVGKGMLDGNLERYFRDCLSALTGGQKERALVVYCQSDCWMGWNAAKRAASYGYRRIYWYPDGIDGWRDHERALMPARAVPLVVGEAAGAARCRLAD
ncbi:MAG: rhodanese-like domain-containing protein [Hyphomicrobiaceae bacterium]|nr:rhodanese-like domain-containing protein [Hyphomicrobiaceae bacterium]